MSFLVARMEKMKSQNLGGIQKHNQREFDTFSNKEIDTERSYMNFDLVNQSEINYRDRIMDIIQKQKTDKRAIRKDAVLVNEWIITSDQKFFENMDLKEIENFFETAADFFKKRYGKQNLAYGQVHLDESTPHMHLGVVPMKDGKLQAKNIFNRKELFEIQEKLPEHLKENGFNLERGIPNKERKNLTVPEFKEMKSKLTEMTQIEKNTLDSIKVLEKEKFFLERQINESKDYLKEEHPQPNVKKFTLKSTGEEIYGLSKVDFLQLDAIRKSSNQVIAENERLESENKSLKDNEKHLKAHIDVLEETQGEISTILKTAQNHASKFAEGVLERSITYAKKFSKNKNSEIEKEKEKILENINESPNGLADYENWKKKNAEFQKRKRNLQI